MTKKITFSGVFLALCIVLPFLTGQVPELGKVLCLMHIPVFLCGMVCGEKFGALVGGIAPILRSLLFSMPVFFPNAILMSLELLTYGLISGLVYKVLKSKTKIHMILCVIISLVISNIMGRIIYLIAFQVFLNLNFFDFGYTETFIGLFMASWPGILLQIVLIPGIVKTIELIN